MEIVVTLLDEADEGWNCHSFEHSVTEEDQ